MSKQYNHKACGDACCLQIRDLGVKIGGATILENVSLHVHCGEMVALIGPNGAGKSTLLKAILGQIEHEGIISFSSPGVRHKRKLTIGYVPQSPNFDPGECMTVADLFACCKAKRPAFLGLSKTMKEKVADNLSKVHAAELMDKRVGTLSGGELQRVLLALALDPLPNLLILDEPLSGVDVEGIASLMDMLDEIRQTYDLSILMTTHDFTHLRRYADQAVLIDGTVLAQGTPDAVLDSEAFCNVFGGKGGTL